MLTASIGSPPPPRGPARETRVARPVEELVGAAPVGLQRAPGEVQPRLARRADAVLPVIARDEVAAGIADDRDAELTHERQHVIADGLAVALEDAAVDRSAHVLDERAEDARVDVRDAEVRIDHEHVSSRTQGDVNVNKHRRHGYAVPRWRRRRSPGG